ncbi:copper resistance protein NlpE [Algoriphagus zhangzhouensis]|uniref:NlpE N-terminal domain-containing protein n=1 Tax=Algoriphagus zhangzhouensis TaxID=1073327 RepID=A0A1M7ZAP3_9BACT|nr:copper resistance protein NlpE [Algoriphagus zhangzhouensis]TDY47162.1 NlpE-like protein [Algoriphagus zhangzhouensis]SHO61879.1 NlpE N-terminal domain-containing protein [Algoriphagus zhangzhouensis]
MKQYLSLLFLISLFAFSCAEKKTELNEEEAIEVIQEPVEETLDEFPETIEIPMSMGDNSRTSLDWNGTYLGNLPCASCEGIETKITLNTDGTYHYTTHYFGLNDALEHEFLGKFTWDETGSIITLQGVNGIPGKYKVGENQLWHLDMDGNRITGDLADRYILKKQF